MLAGMAAKPGAAARDAGRTRAAILDAARQHFTRAGYGVGVREIAASAGVDAALVNRYFGSKEGLFIEAIRDGFSIAPVLAGPRQEFGARVASYVLAADEGGLDPTQVLLRSAGLASATPLLRAALEREFLEPLARWLGGRDAALRAGLIVSVLSGVAIMRDVLAVKGLGPAATTALRREMARLLQQYVDPGA